jgi:hypothetical protein
MATGRDAAACGVLHGVSRLTVHPAHRTLRLSDLLLDFLATSGIQAGRDQRARRPDSVELAVATKLRAHLLLTLGHFLVETGVCAHPCAGRCTSRQQCAENDCHKCSDFHFHGAYLSLSRGDQLVFGRLSVFHDSPSFPDCSLQIIEPSRAWSDLRSGVRG